MVDELPSVPTRVSEQTVAVNLVTSVRITANLHDMIKDWC